MVYGMRLETSNCGRKDPGRKTLNRRNFLTIGITGIGLFTAGVLMEAIIELRAWACNSAAALPLLES